jgi:hypothetical protein
MTALAVVAAAVYFFYLQFKSNADVIKNYDFSLNFYYIGVSIMSGVFALLIGPVVWRMFVNDYIEKKLNHSESFALYCTSAMFKYIPGKIWTYAAQIALLSSKGISKVALLYINLVSFICLFFVAIVIFLYYYFFYVKIATFPIAVLILSLIVIADVIFIVWNHTIINYLMIPVNRLFRLDIKPIRTRKMIFVYTQMYYFLACILLGAALYFLALGINIQMSFSNMFAVMATIAASAILSLVAFFTVGGLGVREGTMYFMLKQFSNIEAALILPVVARFLTIIVELVIAIIAIIIGIRYGYFSGLGKTMKGG